MKVDNPLINYCIFLASPTSMPSSSVEKSREIVVKEGTHNFTPSAVQLDYDLLKLWQEGRSLTTALFISGSTDKDLGGEGHGRLVYIKYTWSIGNCALGAIYLPHCPAAH